MGYYTNFEFSVYDYGNKTVTNHDIASEIKAMNISNNDMFYPLVSEAYTEAELEQYIGDYSQNGMSIEPYDSFKWYEYSDDMLALSKKFPDTVFMLHGDGEEKEYMWDEYYKNGKSVHYQAEITIRPLDPNDFAG